MLRKKLYRFQTALNNWWHGLDQIILGSLIILFCLSVILVAASSPAIAARIGISKSFFIIRQGIYLLIASAVIIIISMLSPKSVNRIAIVGFISSIILLIAVIFSGYEIKGAKRWINIFGISLQPSEFIKPCFFIISGWILSFKFENENFPAISISLILYSIIALFLLGQPDIGTLILLSATWLVQLFVSGMPLVIIGIVAILGFGGIMLAYNFLPHVAHRINTFLGSDVSNNYQITKSLLAYEKGGMFGLGPAGGVVKYSLPDSHTDFIFAVAAEEFGIITCMAITLIFFLITLRTLLMIIKSHDYYIVLAGVGLITQFAMQAIINMSVTLNLVPTKGMTLPFISYGGSSIIATAIAIGAILSFTKKGNNLYTYKIL